MAGLILGLLIVFWILGYIQIPGLTIPNYSLFVFNGHSISLYSLVIFFLIMWAIGILPSPLQEICFVLLLLWVLSTLGIIAISGLPSIIVIAIIVGLLASMFGL